MSDYLDHLAAVSLNQTRGFQFNPGELRPRLASQFEPAVPNASPAAWIDDESDEVESAAVDQASSRSRMIPGQARVSPPLAETPAPNEEAISLSRQSLSLGQVAHESPDRVSPPESSRRVMAPFSTADTAEHQVPVAHEAQFTQAEVQASLSPPSPRSHESEQVDLRDEDVSVRTRSLPVSRPRHDVAAATLRQTSQRRLTLPREQSPESLAPQAAFVAVKRFLDGKFDRPYGSVPVENKEPRHSSAAEVIEVDANEDNVSLPVSNKYNISVAEKAHSLQSSRLTATPPANQVGPRHLKLNRQLLNRREGQAERSVEDDVPAAPIIQVTIGRVEVRAQTTPTTSASRSRSAPVMTLEDYLQRRKTGGG